MISVMRFISILKSVNSEKRLFFKDKTTELPIISSGLYLDSSKKEIFVVIYASENTPYTGINAQRLMQLLENYNSYESTLLICLPKTPLIKPNNISSIEKDVIYLEFM